MLRIPLFVACSVSLLRAQEPADTAAALAEIIVTASRVPVARSAASASVTVLSGADLRARGIVRVADALRDVPGAAIVQTGSAGGQTSLFLRGGESDYAKVLIDGVHVNAAGGAFDFAHLTTANIERIEIVRGPASVLYGSDAVAGVIQIFTRQGERGRRLGLSGRGGTYATRDGEIEAAAGNERMWLSLGAAQHSTDGILAFNNDYSNSTLSGAFRWLPHAGPDLRLSARLTDAEFHYPTDFRGEPVDSNSYRAERRLVLGLESAHDFTPSLEGRLILGVNEVDAVSDDRPDGPSDDEFSHDDSDAARRTADFRVNVALTPATTLSAGTEWQWQREHSTGTSSFAPGTSAFDERRSNRAIYGELNARSGRAVSFTLSGRADNNEKFGTFVTYRAGSSYRARKGTRLRASLGTAYKEPAFIEVFNTSFSRGNPGLKPEKTRSWEAALEQEIARGAAVVSATYFAQSFRNLIQYELRAPSDSRPNYENLAAAIARGVELEARVPSLAGLGFAASYTYLETEVTNAGNGAFGSVTIGQRLLRRPAHSARVSVGYVRTSLGSVNLGVRRVGSRHDVGYRRLPWYTIADVSTELTLIRRSGGRAGVTLTGRIENVLDEEYQEISGFAAPGRTLLLGARMSAGSR